MKTLDYGFRKPEKEDIGDEVFSALEHNIEQVAGHDHDGVNSKKIQSVGIEKVSQVVSSTNWIEGDDGRHYQDVNISGGVPFDNVIISTRDMATSEMVHPSIKKIGTSQYRITVNDPTLSLLAYYV